MTNVWYYCEACGGLVTSKPVEIPYSGRWCHCEKPVEPKSTLIEETHKECNN